MVRVTLREWLEWILSTHPHAELHHEEFGNYRVADFLKSNAAALDDIAGLIAPLDQQVPGEIILMTVDATWWFITLDGRDNDVVISNGTFCSMP